MKTKNELSRRDLLRLGLAVSAGLGLAPADDAEPEDLHRSILDLAAWYEKERRARFAAVQTKAELEALQTTLRETFLRLIGGFPEKPGVPPVTRTGRIEAEDYVVEKLAYESFPGYFVPALLYKPITIQGPLPGVLSPCGHSAVGKAAPEYQILHINLVKRGHVVLTYDPVGQGERSQFWDAEKKRTRFNLGCGEHAVIGNALELLGMSLARYRIWDGMRGVDYLASLPEVDATKIGCVGNSGGGTLTAYITALDPRVAVAAICCYITTLPRRMGNRIQTDPTSDPEQDIFGFVSQGIDHAGLLALCAPRPTLVGSAQLDFFPIEGARESFAEARRLYEAAGAGERIAMVEAPHPHGLTQPLREAVFGWFGRWLKGVDDPGAAREIVVKPRPSTDLLVCAGGQANITLRSRPLLPLALEEFRGRPAAPRKPLGEVLRIGPGGGKIHLTELESGAGGGKALVICINGNETPDWREEAGFLHALVRAGHAVVVVDSRGVGPLRVGLAVKGHRYTDPISSVEANLAYNAFLVGRTLLGLRVEDVAAAARQLAVSRKPRRVILCGRRDAAVVACLTAAVEPAVQGVAAEEMLLSVIPLFGEEGYPLNAASILPGLLRDFGDIPDVVAQIAPRKVLVAAGVGENAPYKTSGAIAVTEKRFTSDPSVLTDWLRG
jgi:dienelactone hydrolase